MMEALKMINYVIWITLGIMLIVGAGIGFYRNLVLQSAYRKVLLERDEEA